MPNSTKNECGPLNPPIFPVYLTCPIVQIMTYQKYMPPSFFLIILIILKFGMLQTSPIIPYTFTNKIKSTPTRAPDQVPLQGIEAQTSLRRLGSSSDFQNIAKKILLIIIIHTPHTMATNPLILLRNPLKIEEDAQHQEEQTQKFIHQTKQKSQNLQTKRQ